MHINCISMVPSEWNECQCLKNYTRVISLQRDTGIKKLKILEMSRYKVSCITTTLGEITLTDNVKELRICTVQVAVHTR